MVPSVGHCVIPIKGQAKDKKKMIKKLQWIHDQHIEEIKMMIGSVVQDLEWLNEEDQEEWIDGHGNTLNKKECIQKAINKLKEID